jgi:hypothetical protein
MAVLVMKAKEGKVLALTVLLRVLFAMKSLFSTKHFIIVLERETPLRTLLCKVITCLGGPWNDSISKDSAGKDNVGKDSAGKDSAGKDSAGKDSAGKDSAGKDSAWNDSVGKGSACNDSAGNGSV